MSALVTQAPVAAVPPESAPVPAAAVPTGTRHAARHQARQRWLRRVVLSLSLALLALPIVALAEFSVRYPLTGTVDLDAWRKIVSGRTSEYQTLAPLWTGLTNSLVMCALTVTLMLVLLLPTMVWVQLRAPRLGRALELVCLLPLTIPAVVLVVGLAPVYRVISTRVLDSSTIWLSFAYVILVLPFAYRALAAGLRAIDLVTLSEAARSFGAGWWVVLTRVVAPNIRSAIVSACFLSVAVVLGEFTLARILARGNLQTALFQINLSDSQVAAAMAFLALVGTTVLLVVVDLLMSRSRRTRPHTPGETAR